MKTTEISSIIIGEDRIREEISEEAVEELAASIYQQGLLHAPVMRPDKDGQSLILVAGENRLNAMKLLHECGLGFSYDNASVPHMQTPFTLLKDDDTINAYASELDENLKRRDLTWKEKAKALAKLHQLRAIQYGETNWTLMDTADEITQRRKSRKANDRDRHEVSEALAIVKHLDDPVVAHAPDKKEALRAIREKVKMETRAELKKEFLKKKEELKSNGEETIDLDMFTKPAEETPRIFAHEGHTLIHGDFFEEAPKLMEGFYDCIVTDPPYGIDIHKHKLWDGQSHEYDDSEDYFNQLIEDLAQESFRVAKDQAHVYVFCDFRRFQRLFVAFELAGFDCWRYPIIWDKGNTGSFGDADKGPRHVYDCILYANKGDKKTTDLFRDVINVTQPSIGSGHPASKPQEVYYDLLRRSTYPGDQVLDFFCGGGPIFPAAHRLDCFATGVEVSDKYHLMALEQLYEIQGD